SDVAVRMTRSALSTKEVGAGFVSNDSPATLQRVLISSNRAVGCDVTGHNAIVGLTDVIVRNTGSQEDDKTGGTGIRVDTLANVTLVRALVEKNRAIGVDVAGAVITATDLTILDTLSEEGTGHLGRGMVLESSTGDVTRARLERNRNLAIYALGAGTR